MISQKEGKRSTVPSNDDNEEAAEEFFQRIMEETNTQITWPSKLKIGAKSKKEPTGWLQCVLVCAQGNRKTKSSVPFSSNSECRALLAVAILFSLQVVNRFSALTSSHHWIFFPSSNDTAHLTSTHICLGGKSVGNVNHNNPHRGSKVNRRTNDRVLTTYHFHPSVSPGWALAGWALAGRWLGAGWALAGRWLAGRWLGASWALAGWALAER
ncbi:hypothetical protein RRG08_009753 [Elysia crispata]|uniref:BICC1 first type I KH domain-containing protein n=1 Tax=Elysia crispata TaxID=231223 RepID=A0AAE0Z0F1_9GAST|nr:hypothetical protein RRG08_009753 [Elysia crispata]